MHLSLASAEEVDQAIQHQLLLEDVGFNAALVDIDVACAF